MQYTMRLKLLGVRGTVPVHGEGFRQFGGATSCVFLQAGDEPIILDAGTGLLTQKVYPFFSGKHFSLLLTHPHVDHLIGLPMFSPLFDSEGRCDVYLKTRDGLSAREQVERLIAPPLWPIRTDAFRGKIQFYDVLPSFQIGRVAIETMDSVHPGGSTIYKLSCGGVSVVYATDYEPENDHPEAFCAFAKDCSLLLLDAQYTHEEYPRVKGFGHSTISRSVEIARRCGAKRTILIHHDPNRTDCQLLEFEQAVQADHPHISFGRQGEEIYL